MKYEALRVSLINYQKQKDHHIFQATGVIPSTQTIWSSGYLDHAFLPRPDWRPISGFELDTLLTSKSEDILREVGIVRMDGMDYEKLVSEVLVHKRSTVIDNKIEELFFNLVSQYVNISGTYSYLGVETTQDSSPTLTWEEDGRRTGLHVDSWFGKSIDKRSKSPNRLCLNLGYGIRYFLFVNKGIDEILSHLEHFDKLDRENKENVASLTASFFGYDRNSPVIAVGLLPGEAYIAPTEYIIHDGFVPGRLPNTTISIMGDITPR